MTELKPEYVDFIPSIANMKEGALYISKKFCTAAHLCACGCGNEVVLPFGNKDNMFWTRTAVSIFRVSHIISSQTIKLNGYE